MWGGGGEGKCIKCYTVTLLLNFEIISIPHFSIVEVRRIVELRVGSR
jgi:hypothetical protein